MIRDLGRYKQTPQSEIFAFEMCLLLYASNLRSYGFPSNNIQYCGVAAKTEAPCYEVNVCKRSSTADCRSDEIVICVVFGYTIMLSLYLVFSFDFPGWMLEWLMSTNSPFLMVVVW